LRRDDRSAGPHTRRPGDGTGPALKDRCGLMRPGGTAVRRRRENRAATTPSASRARSRP
jgi:hypothetical protein